MKAGWEVRPLGEVCVVDRGSSPRPIKKYLTEDGSGVNWIKIGDTVVGGRYVSETSQKITKEGALKSRAVFKGDFILTNSMTYGRPYIMAIDGYIHDGWFVLRLPEGIDTDFFFYLLSSSVVQDQFENLSAGSVVKNISGDLVKKAQLPIPPLEEQKRIVAVLDAAFEGLTRATEHAEANLQNARELFEKKLSATFLDGGEEWADQKMGDLCSLVTDGKHGDCKNEEGSGYYFLSAKDVKDGVLNYIGSRQITQSDFLETHRRTDLKAGDILVTNAGTIGRTAIATADPLTERTTFQKSVAVIKPKPERVNSEFLELGLRANLTKLQTLSSGAAQKNLLLRDIRAFFIKMPKTLEEQDRVASEFLEFQDSIENLTANISVKLTDIADLRQSLLQKAFAGELT